MNFPKTHYLSRPPTVVSNADVILGLELTDFWATVNAYTDNGEHGIGINNSRIKPDTKLISINSSELLTKSNYQDFQRFQSVDVSMVMGSSRTLAISSASLSFALFRPRGLPDWPFWNRCCRGGLP